MKIKYNLLKKIIFCKKCVMSNQRPGSISEFFHTKDRKDAKYLKINEQDGICDACKQNDIKNNIDWKEREKKLIKLKSKFVHEKEKYFVDGFKSPAELTLLWTIKEAIYKALGIKGVIFSKQLYSEKFCFGDQKGIAYYNNNTSDIEFKLYFYYLDNYCLTIAQKI